MSHSGIQRPLQLGTGLHGWLNSPLPVCASTATAPRALPLSCIHSGSCPEWLAYTVPSTHHPPPISPVVELLRSPAEIFLPVLPYIHYFSQPSIPLLSLYNWVIFIQALACVAQWVEHQPANRMVAGSSPSQGTCLGCGLGPQVGGV